MPLDIVFAVGSSMVAEQAVEVLAIMRKSKAYWSLATASAPEYASGFASEDDGLEYRLEGDFRQQIAAARESLPRGEGVAIEDVDFESPWPCGSAGRARSYLLSGERGRGRLRRAAASTRTALRPWGRFRHRRYRRRT